MPRLKTSNGAPALVTKGVLSVLSVTKYAGVATAGAAVLVLLVLLLLVGLAVDTVVDSAPPSPAPWRKIQMIHVGMTIMNHPQSSFIDSWHKQFPNGWFIIVYHCYTHIVGPLVIACLLCG